MAATDPESLQPKQRCRCLDACLVASVASLFLLLLGTATAAALYINQIRTGLSEAPTPTPVGEPKEPQFAAIRAFEKQMLSAAYLGAIRSQLSNGTMKWAPKAYGTGKTVGSAYTFRNYENALEVQRTGSYFLYTNLQLTCTAGCSGGVVTVRFLATEEAEAGQQKEALRCRVELAQGSLAPHSRQCFGVVQLKSADKLSAHMELEGELRHWKLELDSGFGIFLVDGLGQDQPQADGSRTAAGGDRCKD
ncbi:hypothetical protein MATL_G00001290 [Megalops atlanticus]|uniref:THD domain-containing protein n=1 Tax=Megalops atlanticus TaxID=7932 RepID=A0A9D3QJU9_MEGAT|nr:hypothetical protein MATL_G00001290 [Megalops atlanticus]